MRSWPVRLAQYLIARYVRWEDQCCGHDPEDLAKAIAYLPEAELVDGVWVRKETAQ